MNNGKLELGLLQPVVGAEGLGAEVAPAGEAAPALDAAGRCVLREKPARIKTPLVTILPVKPQESFGQQGGSAGGWPLEATAKGLAQMQRKCKFGRHNQTDYTLGAPVHFAARSARGN
jgi:hypothetical protein